MRPLKFYDIKAGRSFTSTQYSVIVVTTGSRAVRLGVAKSPYTGVVCYSFAPKRADSKSAPLTNYL